MTVWKKRLSSIELSERPRMLLLFLQKGRVRGRDRDRVRDRVRDRIRDRVRDRV